jgi:hypothetical protein
VLSSILPNRGSSQGQWIEKSQLVRIYQRIFELAQRDAQANPGQDNYALDSARRNYVEALLRAHNIAEARAVLGQVPEAQRNSLDWLPSVLAVADAEGTLDQLLAAWRKQPDSAPAADNLRKAASHLDAKASRAVRRFVYERALDQREFAAANFLGLASIDLEENQVGAAAALLKRLTLVSENIYADTDAAAQLLEDRHHPAEALAFLRPLADASPWDAGYRLRVAKARLELDPHDSEAVKVLSSVAADPKARYATRTSAAEALKDHGAPATGSNELALLALPGCPNAAAASKPLFVAARIDAAACAPSAGEKERLLRDALAASPADAALRLKYIFAAFDADFDSRALVAAAPYLENAYYYYRSNDRAAYEQGDSDAGSEDESDTQPTRPVSFETLAPAQAARIMELAAAAYERRRDYPNALHVLSMGLSLIHQPALRASLIDNRKHVNLAQARSQENDARAPNVRAELDQDRIVRPRLPATIPLPGSGAQAAKEDQP